MRIIKLKAVPLALDLVVMFIVVTFVIRNFIMFIVVMFMIRNFTAGALKT